MSKKFCFRSARPVCVVCELIKGEVAEWSIAPHSKCGLPKGNGGSNPSLSASFYL
jgi:hypothetical protein